MPFGTLLPSKMPESSGALVQVVSPTGNDTTGNGSEANPWKTINKAWTHASLGGGGIIYLRGNAGDHGADAGTGEGTSVTVTSKFGAPDDPITMETFPGDAQAVIDGTRLHLNPGDLKQNDYNGGDGWNVRLRNLVFKGGTTLGVNGLELIKSNNPRNFEISGCSFHEVGSSAIIIRGMSREQALSGAIDASQTTITLDGVANLLNATPYYIGVTNSTAAATSAACTEIMRVTSVSGNDLTVERGALGTTGVTHISGAKVIGYWTGSNVQIFNNIINRAGMLGTRVNGEQSLGTGQTLTVDDTSVFPATGSLNNTALVVEGVPVAIPYTAKTATTFTLGTVTGGPYTFADNAQVLNSWCSGHAHGIYYGSDWGTIGGAVYNNIIYDVSAMGITLHEETDGTIIANNTLYYCGRGGINLASEGPHAGEDNIVKNNIVANVLQRAPIQGTTQSGFAFNVWWEQVDVDLTAINNTIDRNLWFDCDSGYHQTEGSSSFPTGTDLNFSNDTNSDPQFTAAASGDFSIPSASPAKGIGDGDYTPATDINGVTRATADAGAIASESSGEGAVPGSMMKLGLGD